MGDECNRFREISGEMGTWERTRVVGHTAKYCGEVSGRVNDNGVGPCPPSERRNDASASVSASSVDPTTALNASARSGFTLAANRAPEAEDKKCCS